MRTVGKRRMSEPAQVFEDRDTAGQWRVEWTMRGQALRYAMRKYGHFREVQLERYRQ